MDISVREFDTLRKSGDAHTLLDVREDEELALSAIDGALHIPMNTVPDNLDRIPKDHPVVVMCHLGGRSAQVTEWLRSQGFENALNLTGGIKAWSYEIDPDVPDY